MHNQKFLTLILDTISIFQTIRTIWKTKTHFLCANILMDELISAMEAAVRDLINEEVDEIR